MDLLNLIKIKKYVPNNWRKAIINPIYKGKGFIDKPNIYRGISQLLNVGKIFTGILVNRLQIWTEENNILLDSKWTLERGEEQSIIYSS